MKTTVFLIGFLLFVNHESFAQVESSSKVMKITDTSLNYITANVKVRKDSVDLIVKMATFIEYFNDSLYFIESKAKNNILININTGKYVYLKRFSCSDDLFVLHLDDEIQFVNYGFRLVASINGKGKSRVIDTIRFNKYLAQRILKSGHDYIFFDEDFIYSYDKRFVNNYLSGRFSIRLKRVFKYFSKIVLHADGQKYADSFIFMDLNLNQDHTIYKLENGNVSEVNEINGFNFTASVNLVKTKIGDTIRVFNFNGIEQLDSTIIFYSAKNHGRAEGMDSVLQISLLSGYSRIIAHGADQRIWIRYNEGRKDILILTLKDNYYYLGMYGSELPWKYSFPTSYRLIGLLRDGMLLKDKNGKIVYGELD